MDNFDLEAFWDDGYWDSYLKKNSGKSSLDFESDNWFTKYENALDSVGRNKALDLGAGLGQDTNYLQSKGFAEVISADLSKKALGELKKRNPSAKTLQLDMSKPLPFKDGEFDVVWANLSTHYLNWNETQNLYNEIHRILKSGGLFIGRNNSDKTRQQDLANDAIESEQIKQIEPNYFFTGRYMRYFTKDQFDELFDKKWQTIILNETTTERWGRTKTLWEFIAKKNS